MINVGIDRPQVETRFCVATETFDNVGLPHALEHLVVMASKRYPHVGSLEFIAGSYIENLDVPLTLFQYLPIIFCLQGLLNINFF